MVKTTRLCDEPAPNRNNGNRSVSDKNNNNRPVSGRNNGNGKIDGFAISENGVEHAKKSGKLSKSGK